METDKHVLHAKSRARQAPSRKSLYPSGMLGRDVVIQEGFAGESCTTERRYMESLPDSQALKNARRMKQ